MMSSKVNSGAYLVYLLIFLGLMSAFGPFVTDVYLPSLPAMAKEFHVSASEVQSGIMASLLGLAIGQILFGPLSDKIGRKPIMYFSLILFSLASLGDIYSTEIGVFNVFRFFQGVGGAGGIVLSRSVATDCYSGRELARIMAIIGAINGITPILAPITGGILASHYGWQGAFWCLFGIGIALLALTIPFMESLPIENRLKCGIKQLYGNFGLLMRQRGFLKCVVAFAFANGVLFSYISSTPFIIQNVFGFSDTQFSFVFAINAMAIVCGSSLSIKFKEMSSSVKTGALLSGTVILLLTLNVLLWRSFWCYEICVWINLVGLGLIFPAITAMAMNQGRMAIGAASAIVGAAGCAAGGLISPICGIGDIMQTSAVVMLICVIFIVIFSKKVS